MQSVESLATLWPIFVEVLPRVARIAVLVAVGVFVANLAVGFGLVEYVAGLSKYLTRPANLPDEVGTAILTTAASTTAGYGMLAEFRESGRLSDTATLVAVTINTFFGFVQHIFTFYAPVLIPILGLRVGLMYVGARAAISLGITLTGVLAGGMLLSRADARLDDVPTDADTDAAVEADGRGPAEFDTPETTRAVIREAGAKTWPKLKRLVPRLAIVYFLVTALVETNAAVWLLERTTGVQTVTDVTGSVTGLLGLPSAAVPVIAVFAFDTTVGAATIAPLVGEAFTPRTAVATMLVGGIVSFAVSTFKRSIPFQYGIWGARFGSKVVAVNTALKIVFIGLALVVLLVP
ncbi:hypothetical protein C499_10909 [Halogeometricum borinquense DSM 11551]|uniref:Uncharacterized conserved protein n=2 Tax=Halogeometricum borinquense TaxID=60847 RepID=E4NRN2_HALBP|nr:hypothetical protein [Halogeometricum borinquense]ADQ65708.1 uncharacterized conserved protein [Halogeometricum borinquense DSM 11551]ELY27037.1 hypothetical protein C499_10909 [Halogeometricum borinquense DSM 11551]RYJ15484.1 nucleoside recognition protein [Halogeometricum borinquense]